MPNKDLTNKFNKKEFPREEIPHHEILPSDDYTPPFTITPVEELEKQIKNKIQPYGGIQDLIGSPIIYATIKIGGEDILYNCNFSISIDQKVASHHEFSLICSAEEFNEHYNYPLENSRKLLGKRFSIELHQYSKVTFSFTGIITSLTSKKVNGFSRVILWGQSPTILLENGRDSQSYEKKNLSDIIKESTSEYPSDLIELDLRPRFQDILHYTVQYKESDFAFIKRLCCRYGEWFYYDGQKINIGGYGGKTTEMLESQDFYEFELKMNLVPQKFSYISYDSKRGKDHSLDSDSIELQHPINPYLQDALKASNHVYTKTPLSLYNHSLMESGEMELRSAITREKQKRQNAVYLEAKSNNPNLAVGDLVKMKAWVPEFKAIESGEVPLETYRIIEISHNYETGMGYSNSFIGVPKDNFGPPYTDEDAIPQCEEQRAVVTDNFDPEGYGRVRVQFDWQKHTNQKSPWIRMLQPHSGPDKGFHWKPEIGEEVMVDFEAGNAEKPFVTGSLYNGKHKSGYETPNNTIKALHTVDGERLLFEGKKNIVLQDEKGNKLHIDIENDTITLNSLKNIVLNADNDININAGRDVNVNAGNDMTTQVGGSNFLTMGVNYILKVLGIYEADVQGDYISHTNKDRDISSNGDINTESQGLVENNSQEEIKNDSEEKNNLF